MNKENKPCPFCGNNDFGRSNISIRIAAIEQFGNWTYWVTCAKCHAQGPLASTREEAWIKWNLREDDYDKHSS